MPKEYVSSLLMIESDWRSCPESFKHLRFGQYFIIHYIKRQWPELFYCSDIEQCKIMINQWLLDHCYIDTLPLKKIPNESFSCFK